MLGELGRNRHRLAHDLHDEGPLLARLVHLGALGLGRAVPGRGDEILEDAGRTHDGGAGRIGERHADDLDAEERRVRILRRRRARATGEFLRRPHRSRARHVHVDVLVVAGVLQHRVRVRAAAGLHVGDVLRGRDVGDVEDADAAQPVVADLLPHALVTAVQPPAQALAGHEQQVLEHGDVALRRGTVVRHDGDRIRRVRDVPDLDAVVVALDRVGAGEGEVGVGRAHELLRRGRRRHEPEVPDRLARVEEAGCEPDARIRRGRIDLEPGGRGGRAGGRGIHLGRRGHAGLLRVIRRAAGQSSEGDGRGEQRHQPPGGAKRLLCLRLVNHPESFAWSELRESCERWALSSASSMSRMRAISVS